MRYPTNYQLPYRSDYENRNRIRAWSRKRPYSNITPRGQIFWNLASRHLLIHVMYCVYSQSHICLKLARASRLPQRNFNSEHVISFRYTPADGNIHYPCVIHIQYLSIPLPYSSHGFTSCVFSFSHTSILGYTLDSHTRTRQPISHYSTSHRDCQKVCFNRQIIGV